MHSLCFKTFPHYSFSNDICTELVITLVFKKILKTNLSRNYFQFISDKSYTRYNN